MTPILLHLVSEQTMQNLLPLLALKPKTVVQVRSKEDRFHQAAENLKRAIVLLQTTPPYRDLNPEFFEIVIDEASPSADRSCRKVGESLSLWPGAVVNLTGGTKQMAIGAYLAADYQREPVLYCDTQSRRFLSLNERCPLPPLPAVDKIAATLTVEAVLAAHSVSPEKLRSVKPTEPQLAFARGMHAVHQQNGELVGRFACRVREQLQPRGRTIAKSMVDRILAEGLPGPDNDTEHACLKLAAEAGWLMERDGRWFYRLTGHSLRAEDRLRVALQINKALLGGWFELHVFEAMQASGRFGDLRTEVQSSDRSQQAIGETDIVGLDLRQLGLVFVSCKLSDAFLDKPLEHVFATRHRALEFGGTFAQTIFCVRHFRDPNKRQIFLDACRVVRARLIEGEPDFATAQP
ncbi:MAG: DUF1887 family protein [Chloroflexi bacterium]|nr:DUF1887 family protein [Chloroflexota bacterium]